MIKYFYLAQASTTNSICENTIDRLCNPTGVYNVPEFLTKLLISLGGIIGIITIVVVVYSGLRMIISQGDAEALTKAKSSLQWSIAGFLLTLFAFIIIYGVSSFVGTQEISPTPGQIQNPLASPDVFSFVRTVLRAFLGMVGLIAVLFIIINGFRYLTSAGNEEQTTQAKQGLLWAIIGLMVSIMAYVIVFALDNLFRG
jgi:hypothetical protein